MQPQILSTSSNSKSIDGEIEKRRKVAERYWEHLDGVKGIKAMKPGRDVKYLGCMGAEHGHIPKIPNPLPFVCHPKCMRRIIDYINVTLSSMPGLEEYVEELKPVWDSRWLSNRGAASKKFESMLKKYLDVEHVYCFANGHPISHNGMRC